MANDQPTNEEIVVKTRYHEPLCNECGDSENCPVCDGLEPEMSDCAECQGSGRCPSCGDVEG